MSKKINLGKVLEWNRGSDYVSSNLIGDFDFNLDDIQNNIMIVGDIGTGKTTTAFNLIRELNENSIPFMVFECAGLKEYKNVNSFCDKVLHFTPENENINKFRLNFLEVPEGTRLNSHIRRWILQFLP